DVNGTKDNKVVFQGDRLQSLYADEPGQWERIWFLESKGSEIDHAIIKNGVVGLQVDTLGDASTPAVTLNNTVITNCSSTGLLTQAGAYVVANNCEFSNCGEYTAALTTGGRFEFTHCTFANYWSQSTRETPALLINNFFEDRNENIRTRPIKNSEFHNCIAYGTLDDEFKFSYNSSKTVDITFNTMLVKSTESLDDSQFYNNIYKNKDPVFKETSSIPDMHLSKESFAIDKGDPANTLNRDLDENPRDGNPDLGAYEF
ncbi:MAG: choice-of-anchor Q domain-containing protein, partial [Flavobacteriales bacterium]